MHESPWPEYDQELVAEEMVTVVVQVNGKLRDRFSVPIGTASDELKCKAAEGEKLQGLLVGRRVVDTIVVPDRLVNFVVE